MTAGVRRHGDRVWGVRWIAEIASLAADSSLGRTVLLIPFGGRTPSGAPNGRRSQKSIAPSAVNFRTREAGAEEPRPRSLAARYYFQMKYGARRDASA